MQNWLRKNKELLSIRGIEKAIECPPSTLTKVVNGRNLPKKWVEPLRILACDMNHGIDLERKGAVPYTITEIPDEEKKKMLKGVIGGAMLELDSMENSGLKFDGLTVTEDITPKDTIVKATITGIPGTKSKLDINKMVSEQKLKKGKK